MPIPSPFHPRTADLCTSLRWKDWGGYHAVCSFDVCHEREYYAFRHAAGLIDVTPLFKYEVRGPEAGEFLARVLSKDPRRLAVGQVTYLCWCGEDGRLIDDGTVWRLDEDIYRVTSAEPSLAWFRRYAGIYDVTLRDTTAEIAALSLQGPTSREILRGCTDADVDALRFFRFTRARIDGVDGWISRTGYTGDLGYELWVASDDAVALWDAVVRAGKDHGLEPAALDAMDVTRVEAGFIMNGVDYFSAHHCLIERRKNTPYEVGLGWTVKLDREPFVGQAALRAEKARGPARSLVCLDVDWEQYERLHEEYGLPPHVPTAAWRDGRPVYGRDGNWIGMATSGAWSPLLKRNLALAQLRSDQAFLGNRVQLEVTVEYERRKVAATVVEKPAYDPPRKRA